jgi:hypothetical protein
MWSCSVPHAGGGPGHAEQSAALAHTVEEGAEFFAHLAQLGHFRRDQPQKVNRFTGVTLGSGRHRGIASGHAAMLACRRATPVP